MSSRKIKAALKRKGIIPILVLFQRSCPVPGGYATGYDIEFSDETQEQLYEAGCTDFDNFMEFDTTEDALSWISTLPDKVS